ncbi:hypothetical protein D3C75_1039970 [compost metagenome]
MTQTLTAVGLLDMGAEIQRGTAPGMFDFMLERFERGKSSQRLTLALLVGGIPPGHPVDTENLKGIVTVATGADTAFLAASIQCDGLGIVAEQIDRRRAEQVKV